MATSTRPTAILFDLGGVLTQSPFTMMASSMSAHGIDPRLGAVVAVGADDYGSGNHPFHQLELGALSADQYHEGVQRIAANHGIADFPRMPSLDALVTADQYLKPMIAIVDELRACGYRTGIVTNNIATFTTWRTHLDVERRFDTVVDSCEVGLRKPQAAIYRLAAARLGVEPDECVFLDDMLVNVHGARDVGMTAIHVDNAETAINQLRTIIGLQRAAAE